MDPNSLLSDPVKFGKKVNLGDKLTSDQILESHLSQIRNNVETSRIKKEIKRQQD